MYAHNEGHCLSWSSMAIQTIYCQGNRIRRTPTTRDIMRFILLPFLLSAVCAAPVVRVQNCPVVLPTDATPRIVGGNEASPRTRSHVVSFHEEGCGGSLLSDVWVLTAAHCLVHDGSTARISGTNSSNGVPIPVKRVINHPDYDFPTNDITLVELESPAPSSASFTAVNSNPSIPEDGEFSRVAGYGFQEEGFEFDHDAMLRQVDVPVMNTQKCIDRYESVNSYLRNDISLRTHICAGYDAGGCDSCTADSGGPLFVYDSQNTPIQIAIVSFGFGCAREVPGGYTRVSTYASWMKSVGAVFTAKTARVARFGDLVSGAEADDSQIEDSEEQNDVSATGPRPEIATVPSAAQSPDAVSSPVPLSLDPDTSAATPDETESAEAPSTSQTSPKPSPPARLPPNIASSPPPANGMPSLPQGGHGGEAKPRPEISGTATSEPTSTVEDENTEIGGSTDANDSDSSTSDAMTDESKDEEDEKYEEREEPEEPENDTGSSEEEKEGPEDEATGETETNISNEGPVGSGSGSSSNDENGQDVHRPAPPNPEGGQGSADEEPVQSENENGSESESAYNEESSSSTNSGSDPEESEIIEDGNGSGDGIVDSSENGSESNGMDESETSDSADVPSSTNNGSGPEEGEVIEDDNSSGDGIADSSENGSESNGMDGSETSDSAEEPSAGEIESGPGQPVAPIGSPAPSPGHLVPPPLDTTSQGFEELEPSESPEVTESSDALSADLEAEGGPLGALPITMIAIGSALILAILGYLIYYITNRGDQ